MTRFAVVTALALSLTACAPHYPPANTVPGPFALTLAPEQCAPLQKKRRTF